MMANTFAILGSGMQGTAAAYDIARFGSPKLIRMGDVQLAQAEAASQRVNKLVGHDICEARTVNALDPAELTAFLDGVDVVLSCVPYWMHTKIAPTVLQCKVNMIDLGGNTEESMEILDLDPKAKEAGITFVPDCGLAPGLVNSFGCYILESFDHTESIRLYCGVLPQNPQPPFNYKLTFNMEGLVAEYDYQAIIVRNGEVAEVPTLAELETIHVDGLGEMEAFTTSGGTSTAPYTFAGRVQEYEYKTIRFPGHCALMRIFMDFGFWNEEEIPVNGVKIRPKDVFCEVFGPKLAAYVDKDFCLVRAVGLGVKDGRKTRIQIDIHDREDEVTGFTSMERLTGFSAAIIAQAILTGEVPKGGVRYENAMTGHRFLEELRRRGIEPKIHVSVVD